MQARGLDGATFDRIIVGAGSAGSVIARRLVDAGERVLVVEAGGPDDSAAIHDPAGAIRLVGTELMTDYYTVPQEHGDNRQIWWPRGTTLGGSSSVNGMVFVRGAPADYDRWAGLGARGWDWPSVLPVFKRIEDFEDDSSPLRGHSGPLPVTRISGPRPVTEAFVASAIGTGSPFNLDYNADEQLGVAFTQYSLKDGRRFSAWRAFAHPILQNPRLTVLTSAKVTRLAFDGARVVGIHYIQSAVPATARATRGVVLCAGALMTPQLLKLSGVGPAAELRRFGIVVVVDHPEVGENLQDHILIPTHWESRRPTGTSKGSGLEAQLFWDSGVTDGESRCIDLQPVFATLNLPLAGYPAVGDGYMLYAGVVRPRSRGRVTLASGNPLDPPAFDAGLLADGHDLSLAAESVELVREIGHRAEFDEWRRREIAPGGQVRTRRDIEQFVRAQAMSYHHQVGTARMGIDDRAVVNPGNMRVYGVEGLHVADASVMPAVTTGNTNAPSIMIGELAAGLILAEQGSA